MESKLDTFKLTLALLKTELSINAMILLLYRAGFHQERRHVYDLYTSVMELLGAPDEERINDKMLHFYVQTMDRLTETYLMDGDFEQIDKVVQLFYTELLAVAKRNL